MKHFKKLILRVLIASLIFSGCSNLEDSSEKSAQKYGSLVVNLKQSEDLRETTMKSLIMEKYLMMS